LSNAVGSLNEIDTQLELALRFGYVARIDYEHVYQALDECLALTYGLKKSVNRKQYAAAARCLLFTDYLSRFTAHCLLLTAY